MDSDDEDTLVDHESCHEDTVHHILDEDDDEEEDTELPEVSPQTATEVAKGVEGFKSLDLSALGDDTHSLNYEFYSGTDGSHQSLKKFQDSSEVDIVLSLSERFFETLRECSNEDEAANLSLKDLYLYHAFLALRTLYKLDSIESYWDTSNQGIRWTPAIEQLFQLMPLSRFNHIQKYLKGYKREDDVPKKSHGWKVTRAVTAVQESFHTVLTHPGEYLSAGDGIARGSSCRNPIYSTVGRAKPFAGFRFFILCDYETNIIINFMLDTKDINDANCSTRPGKFAGAVIDELCSAAVLPGRWYKVFTDHNYNSIPLVEHMKQHRKILVCGALEKKFTPQLVHFGKSAHPKPSRIYPKGSLKIAQSSSGDYYIYSWMDSAGVYFIDSIIGPGRTDEISRRSYSAKTGHLNQVPSMIALYNRYMNKVDVFDHMQKNFNCDLNYGTKKYTVRVFEILFSMILLQANNIHRYLHREGSLSRSETDFILRVIHGLLGHSLVSGNTSEHPPLE